MTDPSGTIRKKRKRFILFFIGVAVSIAVLYLSKNHLVRYAYNHVYFNGAFSDSRMMSSSQTEVLNFDITFRDMEFFNTFAGKSTVLTGNRLKGDVNIQGENYSVDLMDFKNYFQKIKLNSLKKSFTIRFSSRYPTINGFAKWDLFQIQRVDYFQQELLYDLGRRLALYVPETQFVNVCINYLDYGNYAFKQSYGNLSLKENSIPHSVIFMLNREEAGNQKACPWTIKYLKKTRNNSIKEILKHFLELLKNQDPNLLEKFFDLDYIARFEALRTLLEADTGFLIAENIRYIYDKFNGNIYPVLDESNIYNLRARSRESWFDPVIKQIHTNPLINRKREEHLLKLSEGETYKAIIANFKRVWQKYRSASNDLLYQIRIKLVAEYFKSNVYSKLSKIGRKGVDSETNKKNIADIFSYSEVDMKSINKKNFENQPGIFLDLMLLPPQAFIEMNENLKMEIKDQKIIMKPGKYTLQKNLIVPMGYVFEISAGTTLKLAPGVSIVCYCPVAIVGTAEKPVRIKALNHEKPFDAFVILGKSRDKKCYITHLDFSGGKGDDINGMKYDGGINIYNANVEITNCSIHHNYSGVGLNIISSVVLLENNNFYANFSDQLGLEFCLGSIRNNSFSNGGDDLEGDGVAMKESKIIFESNHFENLRDKGASIGKESIAVFYDNHFKSNGTGAASRDLAQVLLFDNRFINNKTAVAAYRKSEESGGCLYLLANIFTNNERISYADKFSKRYYLQNKTRENQTFRELIKIKRNEDLFYAFSQLRFRYRPKKNPITAFFVGGTRAQIDEINKIVFINLPKGAHVIQHIRFIPTLKNTDFYIMPMTYGIQNPDRIMEIAREEKIINSQKYDFKEYIFRGLLSARHEFWSDEYELVVSSGAFPIVEIDTANKRGIPRKIKNEPKIPCKIRFIWFNNPEGNGFFNRYMAARIEGRGKKREKWKYGITLKNLIAPEGMKASKRWVLESSYVDKSLMRNKIGYDLFEQFRDPVTMKRISPSSRFVEVILNGVYCGVYLLIEHVDRDFLNLEDFDKNESLNAFLYRANENHANFSRYNDFKSLVRKGYENFPGGRQPLDKIKDPIRGWSSGFDQRHPDKEIFGEYWKPIKDFSKFVALSHDSEFEQNIVTLLDVEQYINLWIFIQLVDDSDGLYQNRYIAREKGQSKLCFIPWDKDGVFGRGYKMDKRPHTLWLRTPLFNRCMKIEWFREALKNTWRTLREKKIISEENIFNMIDSQAAALEDAQKRNFRRWPPDSQPGGYPDSYTFYQEIIYMKNWISKRIQWLDRQIADIHDLGKAER